MYKQCNSNINVVTHNVYTTLNRRYCVFVDLREFNPDQNAHPITVWFDPILLFRTLNLNILRD